MRRALALAVLGSVFRLAGASQTLCTFESDAATPYYEIEFVGYIESRPMIVFSSTAFAASRRITLPPGSYSLVELAPSAARVNLDFRNAGNDSLPQSFTLTGNDGSARLNIGSTVVDGTLQCNASQGSQMADTRGSAAPCTPLPDDIGSVGPALSVGEVEAQSLQYLSIGATTPPVPFGHINAQWVSFKAQMRAGDSLHEYRGEVSGGYLALRHRCLVGQLQTWAR